MERNENTNWISGIDHLLAEIRTAEYAYGTLVTADVYPSRRPYFKKRHFQLAQHGKVLEEELNTITGGKFPTSDRGKARIFEPLETTILEQPLDRDEVDALLVQKEQELVQLYQEVLSRPIHSTVTSAILQSQAEELNNLLLGLRIDLQVKT